MRMVVGDLPSMMWSRLHVVSQGLAIPSIVECVSREGDSFKLIYSWTDKGVTYLQTKTVHCKTYDEALDYGKLHVLPSVKETVLRIVNA